MHQLKYINRLAPLLLSFSIGTAVAGGPPSAKDELVRPVQVAGDPTTYELEKALSEVASLNYENAAFPGLYVEADLWSRIRSGFTMSDVDRASIDVQVRKFAAHPQGMERTSARASKYLYHVVEEIEKRKLPMELALLPFIESAFNPSAYSSAKASGMWQFVPATGLEYNLKQNLFTDDRRNVVASTDAALTYLEKLYGMFGDWQLALAAYNWGEGSVLKAIKKNQSMGLPTDFDSLKPRMPEETKNYVPKLLAVKEIISNPERFGVILPPMNNQPYFASVPKTRDIDVKVAAELAEMPVKDFKELNPQFNKPVITGGSSTTILLPTNKVGVFQENLMKWGKALTKWTSHSVTGAKEKIASIAKRFGTTPEVIREANNIPGKMEVAKGSTLLVPKVSATSAHDFAKDISEHSKLALVAPQKAIIAKKVQRDKVRKGTKAAPKSTGRKNRANQDK